MHHPPHARRRRHGLGVLVLVVLATVGCGRTGDATTRIDEAEQEIEVLVGELVAITGLEPTRSTDLGGRERCQLVTGRSGAANAMSRAGPLPDVDDVLGRASAMLVEAGYDLVDDGDLQNGVFGRRDGIRITVVVYPARDELAIDAATGCRPI